MVGSALASFLRSYRRALSVSAAFVLLYALAGFLLAPWLLKRELPGIVRGTLARELEVREVALNPFALSLSLRGVSLHDTDGSTLVGLDELFVNFELSSLFRRAWTFGEIRLAAPSVNLVRDHAGAVNLVKLIPESPPEPAAERKPPPRVLVQKFRLINGTADVEDRVPATPFRMHAGPVSVAIEDLSTIPDSEGRNRVEATLESGTRVTWNGTFAVEPFHSQGEITIRGPLLPVVYRYLRDQLKLDAAEGALDVNARYSVMARPAGGMEAAITDLAFSVGNLRLSAPASPDFLTWQELKITGGELHWPQAQVQAASVSLTGVHLNAVLQPDGEIDLVSLLTPAGEAPAAAPAAVEPAMAGPAADKPEWKAAVGAVQVQDLSVDFTDATLARPAKLSVADFDLAVRNFSTDPGARFDVESALRLGGGGDIRLKGQAGVQPDVVVDADIAATNLKLAQVQPYVDEAAHIGIADGAIGVEGHLSSDPREQLRFEGNARVLKLDTRDLVKKERLLAWFDLAADDIQLELTARRVKIPRIRISQPFARVFIAQDKTTNLDALLVEPPQPAAGAKTAAPPSPPKTDQTFAVRVGKVQIKNGETDFTDLSLPLPFAAQVKSMQGEVTTIDTTSAAPAKVKLEGQVNEYGLARVDGQVRISSPTDLADITVLFRNVEMAPLSPYTVKFAGRKIAGGKINLDLHYKLDNRQLTATNKIVIDELELGEKVPNPDAMDLPLGLAVALLKDANGRIDLDMPVSGSLDDPQFRIGPVIWKAFINLITKIVTSPFRLLAGLIGVESEDLGKIDFSPGRADLLPPEREKLVRVAEAAAKRPNLSVEVPAVVDPDADAAVLKTMRMEALIEQGMAASGKPASGRGLEKRTRQVVESLYQRQYPDKPLEPLQARFTRPPPDDPAASPRLDELAYLDELRSQIAAAQVIAPEELTALAASRAAAISAELTASGALPADRVHVLERKDVKARDGAWVGAELSLAGVAE